VLDNGRTDSSPTVATDAIIWNFDWADCAGATQYHLFVIGSNATIPLVDDPTITESSFREVGGGAYVAEPNRLNWRWRVRARTGSVWGLWSAERLFSVEPPNSDPPLGCG
jgi:hypothetical protein